jgi:L1 cell adhesion molecule like protein
LEIDSLFQGKDFTLAITRARFEDLCADLIRNTLKPVEKVLLDSGLTKSTIQEVVLVGGSTRIPKVQTLLSEFFNGKKLCHSVNPDEAVAYGAAVQGAILSGGGGCTKDLLLIDVTPLSLGIETAGELMTTIIERNSTIPCKKQQVFSTYADNQPAVTISVFEGERARTRDNNRLGTFNLEGIPPAPRGVPQIEVTFDLDANGILTVSAEDKKTQKKNHVKIENDKGRLNPDDIDRMVKDAEKCAKEDAQYRELIMAKNTLESSLFAAKQELDKQENPSTEAKTTVDGILAWLDEDSGVTLETIQQKQQELQTIMSTVMSGNTPQSPDGQGDVEMGPAVEEVD